VKKLLLVILSVIYPLLAVPAYAQTGTDPCLGGNVIISAVCRLTGANIGTTIQNVVTFLIVLAVIIALIYLLYGGIKWVTSAGDKEKVESARNHITAAIVGLIIVFLAVFIISIVLALFGLALTNLAFPVINPATINPAT
jgi:uncharacterized protein YacL